MTTTLRLWILRRTSGTWNIFTNYTGGVSDSYPLGTITNDSKRNSYSAYGSFNVSGGTISWTAVPEPTSALTGDLLAIGLLHRHD